MPPKGAAIAKLPEFIERATDGKVRCLACFPPSLETSDGWIMRSSLARHLVTPSHADSFASYTAKQIAEAANRANRSRAVALNQPQAPESRSEMASGSRVIPQAANDLQHLDINGVNSHDFLDISFSAGAEENLFEPEHELDINDLDFGEEEDEFSASLPREILESLHQEELDIASLQQRFAGLDSTSDFAPYENKTLFLLDLLDNMPRQRLSDEHMKLIMWIMKEAGCQDVPTHYKFRQVQRQLREACSIRSHQYRSALGNLFEMVDVPELIGRDLSNPLVAPHLVFYPECLDNSLAESWQADKWGKKIPLDQLTPMYADGGKLYYVNELARLHDGRLVIPERWITRKHVLTADCRLVQWQLNSNDDSERGLRVMNEIVSVPATAFASNYFDLAANMDDTEMRFMENSKSFQDQMPNPLRKLAGESEELLSCFIKPWCDDVSGGRSKQYQPHNNIYVAHANTPGELLNQEFHVRFVSTATHASSIEQYAALKEQLDILNRSFASLLNIPADNPAQSQAASHIGGNGNYPCRKCDIGGSYEAVETAEGYRSFFSPGQPREAKQTVQEIYDQISTACFGVEDHVTDRQSSSGVKDPTAQSLITKLIERGREIKKDLKRDGQPIEDEMIMQKQAPWLKIQSGVPFNALFQIEGLDPHRDTPVEILHTILLGIEKYAWYQFHSSTKADTHRTFETRLQASNISGLDIDPIRASYIMNYRNNLIGRHFKMLMQLSVFHVHDLVPTELFTLIRSVGDLGAVLWWPKINNLELYLADLTILVNNVLDAFATLDPSRVVTKIKLHLLTHLVEDIRNHGPAVRFSTEIFECYNGVFRMCSVLSNHQAPSQDIARKMLELERFRHTVCGGYWETENGPHRASQGVRRFFQTSLKLQAHLGWVEPKEACKGQLKALPKKDQREMKWQETVGCRAETEGSFFADRTWFQAESVISAAGDTCKIDSWVVASQKTETIIGKILEILMDSQSASHGVVVIDRFEVSEDRHRSLGMPVLVQKARNSSPVVIVSSYNIDFTINVQHDCISLKCSNSGLEYIRQERRNTTVQRQSVCHRDESVYVLNMHGLKHAQSIREILPRHLTAPIPLRTSQARDAFLADAAVKLHARQKSKREETARKRKAAREARESDSRAPAAGKS